MELTIYPSGIVAALESLAVGILVGGVGAVAMACAVGDEAKNKGACEAREVDK